MVDKKIILSLLSYDFWNAHSNQLSVSLFDSEIAELYEVIVASHEKYKTDIPTEALLALWKDKNPVATRAETSVIEQLVAEIELEEPLPEEIIGDIIAGLWQRHIGKKIGQLGLNIAEGQTEAFEKLKLLLESVEAGFAPDDFPDPITNDIHELLDVVSDEHRLPINIRHIREKLYGPAKKEFWIIFARPETGKTAFAVSLACSPDGWCDKGFKVLYLGNEEDPRRTKLRAIQSYTGMTKDEVIKNPQGAIKAYEPIQNRMIIQSIHGWDITKVGSYIDKIKPDAVIIDQLDKVEISGNYDKTTDKLGAIYETSRLMGNKKDVAMIAVSQASADGEGKTVITADMMENSKTRKYAEADVVMGIGKFPLDAQGNDDPMRFITISKNKATGYHGTIPIKLEGAISRYVD